MASIYFVLDMLSIFVVLGYTGCGRKKWTPNFFCRFLSNCFGF